ncbi:RGM domain family, member D [Neoarius graeffei]|uniref:RGM domain family, member D n=1 Tax=Neoarius graeffei TaxID=443677 RepID=UPI00298C4020|nr:RGM domain family, member D [Neoarius graeffei]
MGRSGTLNSAKLQLFNRISLVMVSLSLFLQPACCQSCRIQRCNAEYVASFSPAAGLQEDVVSDVDYCTALRAYSLCTRRTARGCRGDLVYHSAVFRIKELFAQHNCSSEGPTSSVKVLSTSRPTVVDTCNFESRALALGPADAQKKKYAHCGLFGDPHLRTFKDEFQTCRVEGAWPLIHNRYLSVQVTNVPVVEGSSATATNKITVIFKAYRDCTEQKVYQATTDDVPSAFQDGTRSGGHTGSLRITEGSGHGGVRQVTINARYLGTSIIVRRVGRYLTFAIRVPEEMVEESGGLQLCLHGCPRSELINAHVLSRGQRQEESDGQVQPGSMGHADLLERATSRCRETLQVEDVYFQSCVFDILTTGDVQFSMAAFAALQDLKALPPSTLEQSAVRTPHVFNRTRESSPSILVITLLLLLILLKRPG